MKLIDCSEGQHLIWVTYPHTVWAGDISRKGVVVSGCGSVGICTVMQVKRGNCTMYHEVNLALHTRVTSRV